MTAIDSDRAAQWTIAQNIHSLGLRDKVTLIRASSNAWLETNPDTTFDIIVCDPPYTDLQPSLLVRLAERLAPDGILVVSWPADKDLPEFAQLKLLDHKTYGDMSLAFYSW